MMEAPGNRSFTVASGVAERGCKGAALISLIAASTGRTMWDGRGFAP